MSFIKKYKGILPAFYACYDDKGNISEERTKSLAIWLKNKGVQGLYLCGSSGECIYQTVEERKQTLEWVMSVVGEDLTIIVHVAANNTMQSMELATHAELVGADAIASIPPIYFKLPEYSIEEYWNDISSAAPNTDFIIYNIPQLAGVSLTPNMLKNMIKNPKVIGVKNSSMPVLDIQQFKKIGGENIVVFNGPDEQYLSGRIIGADGGIGGTYAIMPELFLKMESCILEGNLEKAKKIQIDINQIIFKMLEARCNLYAIAKEVLRLQGIDVGTVRKPLSNLMEGDREIAKEANLLIEKAKKNYL